MTCHRGWSDHGADLTGDVDNISTYRGSGIDIDKVYLLLHRRTTIKLRVIAEGSASSKRLEPPGMPHYWNAILA